MRVRLAIDPAAVELPLSVVDGGGVLSVAVDEPVAIAAEMGVTGMELPLAIDAGGASVPGVLEPPVVQAMANPYAGPYTVTPSNTAQVLATSGREMTGNVTINPIPSNYGLITWNGTTLTVS